MPIAEGRGVDEIREIAFEKSVAECIERIICISKNPTLFLVPFPFLNPIFHLLGYRENHYFLYSSHVFLHSMYLTNH